MQNQYDIAIFVSSASGVSMNGVREVGTVGRGNETMKDEQRVGGNEEVMKESVGGGKNQGKAMTRYPSTVL